ncbi:MAG: ATP-binding cassette domain-containing protein, partial [Bacteroidia bacterium]|nr:ATP-binding cassette domain-containing protein [Bacteroidia bacterium]
MSERILKALMQLFAIIAPPESNAAEVLKICMAINEELTQKQKIVVLVRLFEFIKSDFGEITGQELEFVEAVSDTFHIPKEEYKRIKAFVLYTFNEIPNSSRILLIDDQKEYYHPKVKHITCDYLDGQIRIFSLSITDMHLMRYLGDGEFYLNGQLIQKDKVYVLSPGSSIRNKKIKTVYYSDIISAFNIDKLKEKIVFEIRDIEYRFKGSKIGLHQLSFTEESGKLVGIMGASGSGKTTLLNVLNGSYIPSNGEVFINCINIHSEKEKIEGLIGYVSQDDLLIEELTVFQNLYYNAKLCFDNYSEFQIIRTVLRLLQNLGLYEIKDMKVGSPLNKNISGGQRKRLNISLELIREPSILFLDEPTSGLSSRDSENIMDLLKELALKGKLVFVVIHQPSSEIFKMFNSLIILDDGGYLIYSGDPVDSIIYFKSRIHQANWSDSECLTCGNVNPEQIFNIVEQHVLDEYGNLTHTRRISPSEWNENFLEMNIKKEKKIIPIPEKIPPINFKIPNKFRQFKVFVVRDILSKIANTQYMIINLVEAPFLAFALSFIIKYYNVDVTNELGYTLYENSNLPVYIFMAVIIAFFMGLTVSAEEIIKDRLILKREQFLNLSRASYLMSKVTILLTISAIQALTFVLLGNTIMEIKGIDMYFRYWLIIFSTFGCANLLGLNISDTFKTAVSIYILIPFLVIP